MRKYVIGYIHLLYIKLMNKSKNEIIYKNW